MNFFAIITMILQALSTLIPQIATGCGQPIPTPPAGPMTGPAGIDPNQVTLNNFALVVAAELTGADLKTVKKQMDAMQHLPRTLLAIKATTSPKDAAKIAAHPNKLQQLKCKRVLQLVASGTTLPPGTTYEDVSAIIQDRAASTNDVEMAAVYKELGITYP